tara:strand:- start:418 stop:741 length:324 start_codon:yes stop_codon:yes gene_type:complete
MMKKKLGNVKVKSMNGKVDDIPEDCGYDKRFKYDIDMNSNGIMGECIEWCQINCKSKWGWWFDQKELYNRNYHNWEEQDAYMSFEDKREATAFFLAIGLVNMGNKDA